MEMILGIRWENTALGTEFARNYCAGIGPLQLGVVLVLFLSVFFKMLLSLNLNIITSM